MKAVIAKILSPFARIKDHAIGVTIELQINRRPSGPSKPHESTSMKERSLRTKHELTDRTTP